MRETWQFIEIASLRPEHHAVQGFFRNDILLLSTYLSHSRNYSSHGAILHKQTLRLVEPMAGSRVS